VGQVEGQPNAPFRRRANQSQVAGKFAQMPDPSLLWVPSQSKKAKRKRGERKRGSIVPPRRMHFARRNKHVGMLRKGEARSGTHCRCSASRGLIGRRSVPPVSASVTLSMSPSETNGA
jgi:hypothetical protein